MVPAGLMTITQGGTGAMVAITQEARDAGLVIRAYNQDYWNKTVITELAGALT